MIALPKTPRSQIAELVGARASLLASLFRCWAAGLFALPEEVERGLDRLGELQDIIMATSPATLGQVASEWSLSVVAAAQSGAPAPTLESLEHACAVARQSEHTLEALRAAQQALSAHIVDRILVRREWIFNECVRPPLADLHAQVMEVAEVLGPRRSAQDLLTGTDAQRAAWLQLPALAARYHKLRGAVVSLDHGFGHWQIHYSLSSEMPDPKSDVDVLNMSVPNPIEDGPLIVTEPDQHVDVAAAARGAAAVNAYVSEVRRSRSADDESVWV